MRHLPVFVLEHVGVAGINEWQRMITGASTTTVEALEAVRTFFLVDLGLCLHPCRSMNTNGNVGDPGHADLAGTWFTYRSGDAGGRLEKCLPKSGSPWRRRRPVQESNGGVT